LDRRIWESTLIISAYSSHAKFFDPFSVEKARVAYFQSNASLLAMKKSINILDKTGNPMRRLSHPALLF
jgi:hypothetical protein